MDLRTWLLVNLSLIIGHCLKLDAPKDDAEIRKMLSVMLKNYDPKLRPNYLGEPVEVIVDATVLSISNIDEVSMVYTLDMFFRQRWQDDRLRHPFTDNLTLIMGSKQPCDVIWVPDTVFIDSVASKMHHVTVNNHKVDINYDGSVFWGTRVTVSPSCPLNLKAYPMDSQECPFAILSYAYTSRHVIYEWNEPGMTLSSELPQMAQFVMESYTTSRKEIVFVAGNYTVLAGHFHFKRLMGFAVMQIYIPTICVVIVSWISLWVKRTAVPARIALLITTLLTISTMWASVNAQLPRVNYVKAIDIFMMTSFGSVIMALLEFTVVMNTDFVKTAFRRTMCGNSRTSMLTDAEEEESLKKNVMVIEEKKIGDNMSLIRGKENVIQVQSPPNQLANGLKGMRLRYRTHVRGEVKDETSDVDAEAKKKEIDTGDRLADSIENCARILFPIIYTTFLLCYFAIFLVDNH